MEAADNFSRLKCNSQAPCLNLKLFRQPLLVLRNEQPIFWAVILAFSQRIRPEIGFPYNVTAKTTWKRHLLSLCLLLSSLIFASPFSSTDTKFKSVGVLLLMSEIACPTPYISANCLPVTPLSDCSIIFGLSANDNTTRVLLERQNAITNKAKHRGEKVSLQW